MKVLEYKLKLKDSQKVAIDEAIRTARFVRNKCLALWVENNKNGKYDLNKYSAVVAKEFEFADKLNSTARQASAERAWSGIARFYDNCKKKIPGKKGYPKFKKDSSSVEYKQSGWKIIDSNHIKFTDGHKIGKVKLIGTWNLASYGTENIKRVRLVKRADGYYCQFCLSVENKVESEPTNKTVGIDLGLNYFIATSDSTKYESPKFYRKSQKKIAKLNRRISNKFKRGVKQSNNYGKARNRYARKHLRVSRQRIEYCKKIAYCVIKSNDLVAYEDLNVKNMVKNRSLAKSISDAGWSTFKTWLKYFGTKYGKVTVGVPPQYTSQECHKCGSIVKKALSVRTHNCLKCGYIEDRDVNAAKNILRLGLEKIGMVSPESTLGESRPLVSLEQSCDSKSGL